MTEENKNDNNELNESSASYNLKRQFHFFNSFEEMATFELEEMAKLSYDDRMIHAEILRRGIFNEYLLPDGKWIKIARVFTIMKPHV